MGATCTVLVHKEDSCKQVANNVVTSLGCRPQFTIETSGAQSSLRSAIYVSICTHIIRAKCSSHRQFLVHNIFHFCYTGNCGRVLELLICPQDSAVCRGMIIVQPSSAARSPV